MLELKINLDTYLREFQQQLTTHLASLRATLRALEDGSFHEKVALQRSESVIHFQVGIDEGASLNLVGGACNRCFLDLTRALITYMDRMISIRRLKGTEVKFPPNIHSNEDLQSFVLAQFESHYRSVAADRRLTNPRKLQELSGLGTFEKQASLSYFELRRCLEHHGSVPSSDITIYFIRPVVLAGDVEITQLPYVAPENTGINLRIDRPALQFLAGQKVQLKESDAENISMTLQMLIGPEIRRVVSEST